MSMKKPRIVSVERNSYLIGGFRMVGNSEIAPETESWEVLGGTITVPIENCIIRGVRSENLGPTWVHLLPN